MKKESLYVIGAGNHAKIVLSTLEASGMECAGIYDDDASLHGKCLWNVPILGPISALADTPGTMAVIAISDNDIRKEIASRFENICWSVLVHPQTCVHSSVHLREGTVVFPGALILADTKIGAHTIINTAAVINQDAEIGSFCHIAPSCAIGNSVKIADRSFIGMGAIVIPYVSINENVTVGAGSTVIKDSGPEGMYVGSPARRVMRPVLEKD